MQLTLVENFYSWARTVLFGNDIANGVEALDSVPYGSRPVLGVLKDTSGEEIPTIYFSSSQLTGVGNCTLGFFKKENTVTNLLNVPVTFLVGNNNEAAQSTDYQLKSPIETGITINGSVLHTAKYLCYSLTLVNTSTEEKTIGEIGLYKNLQIISSNSLSSYKNVLLGRATLDIPEIIAPQTSKTYQITLEL